MPTETDSREFGQCDFMVHFQVPERVQKNVFELDPLWAEAPIDLAPNEAQQTFISSNASVNI